MSARRPKHAKDRRGAILAFVAIILLVLMSLAALALDLSFKYQAHTEMQYAADSASLAAAGALATEDGSSYLQRGIDAAVLYAGLHKSVGMNNQGFTLNPSDVVFGDAVYNTATKRWTFSTPSTTNTPFGVQITLRRDGATNPAVPFFFAGALGIPTATQIVTSTAMVAPRDIVLVLDLSRSMTDDSLLSNRNSVQINLRDIWVTLNSVAGSPLTRTIAGNGDYPSDYVLRTETASAYAAQVGRTFGSMAVWGTNIVVNQYNQTAVTADLGMYYLPPGQSWNTASTLGTSAASPKYAWLVTDTTNPYALVSRNTAAEITNILVPRDGSSESTTLYRNRVQVLLGFANWHDTNANQRVDAAEMTATIEQTYNLAASWNDWIDYVRNGYDSSYFQYRYGLKAYVNWLADVGYAKTAGVAGSTGYTPRLQYTPIAKLQACKDAILTMSNALKGASNAAESSDRVGLVVFGTNAANDPYTAANGLTSNFDRIADLPYPHQPGEIGPSTNTPEALLRAYVMLQGPGSRPFAHKMIVLLTDGLPTIYNHYTIVAPTPGNKATLNNVSTVAQFAALFGGIPSSSQTSSSGSAQTETLAVSRILTSGLLGLGGVELIPVGVGSDANQVFLQTLADMSGGVAYMAVPNANDPTVLATVLQAIALKVASQRPIALIK